MMCMQQELCNTLSPPPRAVNFTDGARDDLTSSKSQLPQGLNRKLGERHPRLALCTQLPRENINIRVMYETRK